ADSEGTSLEDGWHPHMMVYAPYAVANSLGVNPFGAMPIVGDDAGTPFAVIYISVDPKLAVMPREK
ncbi:hypothetical protein, partial [Bosea sp. TAB14]|uniref:hypothetical protein n=1 Tax=Bosea sp. TAB14 TaxID=3237481 RepID=UPI003F93CBAB